MGIIRRLPPHVANCIAAGEVVERPASVVKELLENAVDAGADTVTVEIRGGGIDEIVVSDNGCGMEAEDASAAFLRHATSKIATEADLSGILTLGFRGEALAAIAAVSRVTLTTRARGAASGLRLVLEAGEVVEETETACAEGTVLAVRDLFFNTPARMKFLRRTATEAQYVAAVAGKIALSHPELRLRFDKDGRTALQTAGDNQLLSAVYGVCGREFAASLLPVTGEGDLQALRVWGYVTRPAEARPNRQMQYFFLNGRAIQSRGLTAALEEACRGHVATGRFPGCVLHTAIAPELADVNVHPAKLEVKFADERAAFEAVYFAVRSALGQEIRPAFTARVSQPVPAQTPPPLPAPFAPSPQPPVKRRLEEQEEAAPVHENPPALRALPNYAAARPISPVFVTIDGTPPPAYPTERIPKPAPELVLEPLAEPPAMPEPPPAIVPEKTPPCRVVGEVFDTYIVAECGDEVWFVDKHAAHERMQYERLRAEYASGGAPAPQRLLTPLLLTVSAGEAAAIEENQELLREMGLWAEEFGEGHWVVRELPAYVDADGAAALLSELAKTLSRTPAVEQRDAIIKRMACHSAVRGGEKTSPAEQAALLARLIADPSLRHCPHGRPVTMVMSRRDFIRNFKR